MFSNAFIKLSLLIYLIWKNNISIGSVWFLLSTHCEEYNFQQDYKPLKLITFLQLFNHFYEIFILFAVGHKRHFLQHAVTEK